EKNVRQSMMPQHKYSKVAHPAAKGPLDPGTGSGAGQNAVIKVTTCIQTNNIRVDSATQSDGKFACLLDCLSLSINFTCQSPFQLKQNGKPVNSGERMFLPFLSQKS